ncbi:MAG: hypothetical protein ACLQU1_24320 [Bryobacteraceae bacterium]
MRSSLAVLIALLPAVILAQPAREAKEATDLPCKLTDFRIARSSAAGPPDTVAVRCDGTELADFAATAMLYRLEDESVAYPEIEKVNAQAPTAKSPFWLIFRFAHGLQLARDYELRISGTYARPSNRAVAERFPATRFRFSTSADLAIAKTPGRDAVYLTSHVEMQVSDAAKLIDHANNKEYALEPASTEPDDYDTMGQILLRDGPSSLGQVGAKLAVQGVTDAFGLIPPVNPPKPTPPAAAPKSKDASTWYLNFLHQAGVGITPTWIANIKLAPVFRALPGGLFVTPSLNVDVGQGQVGQTNTNDLINPKLGVTRLIRIKNSILEGVRFVPSFSYETNRERDKENALFDGDCRFYVGGLNLKPAIQK